MSYVIGTIYKIYYILDPTIMYIGSTYNILDVRFEKHKTQYNKYLKDNKKEYGIFPYFKESDVENFEIIKIKDYLVYRQDEKDHKHINDYEQLWINKLKCVNKYAAFNPLVKDKRYRAITYAENTLKRRENETPEETIVRKQKQREYNAKG